MYRRDQALDTPPAVDHYRKLFQAMGYGWCELELVRDADGRAVDQRYLEFNPAFERLFGIPVRQAQGRTASEVFPSLEPWWTETFDRIARHGQPEQIEHAFAALGRWFEAYVYPKDSDHLVVLYEEITGRKRAEEKLRLSEERQAFLLALGDAMRAEALASDKIKIAAQLLGKRLGASRILYAEYDWDHGIAHIFNGWFADGAQPFPTQMRLEDYEGQVLNDLRAGRTVRVDNVGLLSDEPAYAAIADVGVQALLSPPLILGGKLVMNISVHQHDPRVWTDEEVALVQEVAERLWAEVVRARAETALRESENKYRSLFNTVSQGLAINQLVRDGRGRVVDARFLDLNPAYEAQTGFDRAKAIGRLASEIFPLLEPFWLEMAERVVETGQAERTERYVADTGRWFAFNMVPFEATDQFVVLYENITERRQAEAAQRENEKRQAFLLKLSDALRPLADAEEIQATTARLLGAHLGADRAMYAEVSGEPGAETGAIRGQYIRPAAPGRPAPAPFPDHFSYESFGTEVMARRYSGEGLAVADVETDDGFDATERAAWAKVGVRAAIVAPLVKANRLVAELGVHSETPRTWTDAEISLVREAGERTWAAAGRARAEGALYASEERFRQFAMASSAGLWIRDAATLEMEYTSPAIGTIYGLKPEDMLGGVERWAATILPEDRGMALDHLEAARQGVPVVHEFRIQRATDWSFRWLRNTDFPLQDEGEVRRIGGIAEDVTEVKLAVEHQAVLLAELQHRVRNIMGMIRAIANRSSGGASDVEDYRKTLEGRLLALARVQVLLTRQANSGASLHAVLEGEIEAQAHHSGQYELSGPDISLSPKAVEVLTLAFHELATNALKYGGLSVPAGRVTVRWQVTEKQGAAWLSLDWREEGAPLREPSTRKGFGSELIEMRIPYELKGSAKVTIEAGQAYCHLEIPLQNAESILETDAPAPVTVHGGSLDMTNAPDLSGKSILVVEDDYYMAEDVTSALRSAGAQVLGPCPTQEAALALLEKESPSSAVLDLNLGGGGPRFEIARHLRERGVPFIFLTGYDPDVIPADMDDVARLQKPLPLRDVVEAVSVL